METRSLAKKYEELLIEHGNLKYEFSENVIIQSINDMRDINEDLSDRLNKLNKIIEKIFDYNTSAGIMLNTISKNTDISKYTVKCRVEFVEEVLLNCKKLKSDICYINYPKV